MWVFSYVETHIFVKKGEVMREKTTLFLRYGLRIFVLLAVFGVFGAFSRVFGGVWDKCIVSGVFAAYTLVLLSKWGVIEWLQVHGCKFVSDLASCQFCLSWWLCVLFALVGCVFAPSAVWLLATFVGTMICRCLS